MGCGRTECNNFIRVYLLMATFSPVSMFCPNTTDPYVPSPSWFNVMYLFILICYPCCYPFITNTLDVSVCARYFRDSAITRTKTRETRKDFARVTRSEKETKGRRKNAISICDAQTDRTAVLCGRFDAFTNGLFCCSRTNHLHPGTSVRKILLLGYRFVQPQDL
jgi:hypothetical protein